MTEDILFEQFDLLADMPGGVQKLRELILQLAVQGKLVPQDPEEEPASVLLGRIKEEKEQLVREGKIKKQKPLPEIKPEEVPFELPEGWEWARLEELCQYIQRGKSPVYCEHSDIPVVSQKCIKWRGFDITPSKRLCPEVLINYQPERFLRTGDLLWNSTGTSTIGRVNVYIHKHHEFEAVVADSHVTVLRPLKFSSYFLEKWLSSLFIQKDFETRFSSGTTNQIELPTATVKMILTPLPPLAEQKRIVSKVDQLMTLCDELEAKKEKQKATHDRLNKSALQTLRESKTNDDLAANWTRVKNNFRQLFTTPEAVQELRSTILQLAVQGKLVPQNPQDELASALLERIREEKQRLVKEGKIKKQKPLPEIKPEEEEKTKVTDLLLKFYKFWVKY